MLETVTSIVRRSPNDPQAIAAQLMYLLPTPEELPTLDQMQTLISLAYRLGWKDRGQSLFRKTAPHVSILRNSDGGWTFLYDGQPRP